MLLPLPLLLLLFSPAANGYNILMYSIKFGYSHMNYIGSIADTLQEAGYNVTVIMPQVDEAITSTGVQLARVIEVPIDQNTRDALGKRREFEKGENAWLTDTSDPRVASRKGPAVAGIYAAAMQNILNQQSLMDSLRAAAWDLGIFELLDYGGYPVLYEAGVTNIVGDLSVVSADRVYHNMGIPQAWSYVPALQSPYPDDGGFLNRLYNLIFVYYSFEYERIVETAGQNYMDQQHPEAKKIAEVVAEMPFIFTNSEPLIDFPRPTLHKVVDIGGIVLRKPKLLDEKWVSLLTRKRTNVLISFGTLMKSSMMPEENKRSIVELARRFPDVTFIWKYETPDDGTGSGQDNLHLVKWMPQTDLLASGKIDLFVAHGGAGSVIEATTHGVPMISFPIFFDQYRNSKMIERFGNGIIFDKMDLASADKIEEIVRRGLTDSVLREKATLGQQILQNMPFTPQEKLLRHVQLAVQFGNNLTSWTPSGRNFSLVQFYSLDIIGLVLAVFVGITVVTSKVIGLLCGSGTGKSKIE